MTDAHLEKGAFDTRHKDERDLEDGDTAERDEQNKNHAYRHGVAYRKPRQAGFFLGQYI